MAPRDPFRLLRWQYVPVQAPTDGAIRWKWCAYTQTGDLAMESKQTFETLTECMEDAKGNGYGRA